VVRSNGTDDVLTRAMNLLIARGAYHVAARLYPDELVELRQGARGIERSNSEEKETPSGCRRAGGLEATKGL
jgi:hypothetical protein